MYGVEHLIDLDIPRQEDELPIIGRIQVEVQIIRRQYGILGELFEFLQHEGIIRLFPVLIGAPFLKLIIEEGRIVAFLDEHCVLVV